MINRRTFSDDRLNKLKTQPIDLSDIPEVTEAMWKSGHLRNCHHVKNSITMKPNVKKSTKNSYVP